jgi:hypothetical protein
MSESSTSQASGRKTGKVTKVFRDYGFISCAAVADKDVYFKLAWFRGSPPPRVDEAVEFDLTSYATPEGTNWEGRNVTRVAPAGPSPVTRQGRARSRLPTSPYLLNWAYLGYLPNVLAELQGLALPERWEFKNAAPTADRPYPILSSYLRHTFGRLVLEKKISINEEAGLAAFNTGLVDPRYEMIYALFTPNDDNAPNPWRLAAFCIAGEGAAGQDLVRHFNPLPAPAHYFDNPVELLYDTRAGTPDLDWKHVIIDRIDRYPKEFIEDHLPTSFTPQDVSQLVLD